MFDCHEKKGVSPVECESVPLVSTFLSCLAKSHVKEELSLRRRWLVVESNAGWEYDAKSGGKWFLLVCGFPGIGIEWT